MNWLDHTQTAMVNPNAVDLDDVTYLIPHFSDIDPLRKSIERVGLINAPVVQMSPSGVIIPVMGRRRMQCLRELGKSEIPAKVLPKHMPVADGFALAFWDNAAHRNFDPATRAYIVKRLLELNSRETIASDFLPVLGVAPKGPRLELLKRIGSMEHSVLKALADARINEKTAALLCDLDSHDRIRLLELMESLHLNTNKIFEVISWLVDLSVVNEKTIDELLARQEVGCILADDSPLVERAERFRNLVRSWKFPELVLREQEFHAWAKNIAQPGISVRPTPMFENPQCVVEVHVHSLDEAESVVDALKRKEESRP
ncbi:ParB/RepB/Spo0J family partition protein [Desulfomonile tiedjei]|uniref:ParB-like nuclease n=1 Tax=Desulfomonile tiedjei (strain ATCC 49306 / DSM 6799 / DCB-1) TaxID=706587 RepID=I4C9Z3_DESTA|nr:ParB N-terminal domain-containing protein [Desulfomonile tiedjei]AFM26384.1 ParB-like nuclease [Desulfomonile tiedjei DSM 6799]